MVIVSEKLYFGMYCKCKSSIHKFRNGSQLGIFYDHSKSITNFIPVPSESGKKISVMAFGKDNILSLINVDDMTR